MKRSERKSFWFSCLVIMMLLSFSSLDQSQAADPLDTWYWRNPLPQGNVLTGAAYGNGTFVAVGDGTILTSPDGDNWIVRDQKASYFAKAAFGNGKFVAVGGGTIWTSMDGITWATQYQSINQLYNVGFGNGLFVAVGQNGTIMTSTDSKTWVSRESGTTDSFFAVTYGNGMFITVGGSNNNKGIVLSSRDGVNWTSGITAISIPLNSIGYGNGKFVAVGGTEDWSTPNVILVSSDGLSWIETATEPVRFNGIAFGNGVFVVVGLHSGGFLTSSDGATWTRQSGAASTTICEIMYGNGTFVAVGYGGIIQTSVDGITWKRRTSENLSWYYGITYGNGTYVAVTSDNNISTSSDGVSWVSKNIGYALYGITYNTGLFIAVGSNGVILTSLDGTTWVLRTSGANNYLRAVTRGNGTFVAVGDAGTILTSTDSVTWTPRVSGITNPLTSVTYGNGIFVAVGATTLRSSSSAVTNHELDGGSIIMTSSDGVTWTERTSGIGKWLRDITYGNGTFVAVGGGDVIITSTDGINWITRQTANTNTGLACIAYGNGVFVAMSEASYTGYISTDGVSWSTKRGDYFGFKDIVYANGAFVAVGWAGAILQSGVMNTHEIISTADPNGTISPAGSVRVTNGESQTFIITPNAGVQITDVLVDGVSLWMFFTSPYTYTFTNVTADHTIRATFTGGKQITSLTLSGVTGSLTHGSTQTLTVTVRYSDNSTEVIPNTDAAWTSLNTQIATVGTTSGTAGVVQAIAQGKTTIAAVYKGFTGNLEITVGILPIAEPQHRGNLILVAGGGVRSDNTIKDATLYLADLVYSRFKSRFFTDEEIYYYRPISWVDLNGDGNDDHIVDVNLEKEEFTVADFGQRITQWAANQNSDGPLYIYLIDHGGMGSFELYPYQILTMAQLNTYLNVFQERTRRPVVVVIEACKSGSFIPGIVQTGQNRIVITSAGRTEQSDSYMDLGGRISFTQLFMDRFSAGDSVSKAYQETINRLTTKGVPYSVMQPQLEDGIRLNSTTTYLGGSFGVAGLYPEIIDQTPSQGIGTGGSLTLQATLSSLDRVTDVWAVITPPDYTTPTASGAFQTPTVGLPVVQLTRTSTGERFTGIYKNFGTTGEYRITFYAATSTGRISNSPATIVTAAAITATAGDINNDGTVNLTDAILGLRITTEANTTRQTINTGADVNGDAKIGLPETIYILQKAAGIR